MLFVMLFLLLWVFMLVPREGLFVIHFKVLYPGALNGLCLARKTIPQGCPGGQPTGKQMISAQGPGLNSARITHFT